MLDYNVVIEYHLKNGCWDYKDCLFEQLQHVNDRMIFFFVYTGERVGNFCDFRSTMMKCIFVEH